MLRPSTSVAAIAVAAGLIAAPAGAAPYQLNDGQLNLVAAGTLFKIDRLVADQNGRAPTIDPLLVNPWGLSQAPGGPLWVANNGTGTSTLYNKDTFAKMSLEVSVPAPGGGPGTPTGTTFVPASSGTPFPVTANGKTGRSVFTFATEDGTITGWNPAVDPTNAIIAVNRVAQGAVYKGLTYAVDGTSPRLYAADFANNSVDMFDTGFARIGGFTDPNLPTGYAPFNAQALNGKIYVTFALKQPGTHDEAAGAGRGFVDVFNANGTLAKRLVSHGPLDAPWGLTIAPDTFGPQFAGALLVGNFGDGKVNAFDPDTGKFLGQVTNVSGLPVNIDGLWALTRGPNGQVVFSAGTHGEQHGLVGAISPGGPIDLINFLRFPTHALVGDLIQVR